MRRIASGVVEVSGSAFSFPVDVSSAKGFLFTTSGPAVDIYLIWRVNENAYFYRLDGDMTLVELSKSGITINAITKNPWVNYSVLLF